MGHPSKYANLNNTAGQSSSYNHTLLPNAQNDQKPSPKDFWSFDQD